MSFSERIGIGREDDFDGDDLVEFHDIASDALLGALSCGVTMTLHEWCDLTPFERAVVERAASEEASEEGQLEEMIRRAIEGTDG